MRMNKIIAGGLAGAVLLVVATPTFALPLNSNGTAVTEAAPVATTDVRWRRGWGWGLGGLGVGLAAGALAAPYYGYGYGYGPGYGYDPGYYYGPPAPAYGYGPAYYGGAPVYAGPQGGDAVGYCMSRFRSYDPRSGTYLGSDGYRHPCP